MPHFITLPLRALLDSLHPLFPCCSSCGEIKLRKRRYLCGSLAPAFDVDCVVLAPGGKGTNEPGSAAKLIRGRLPWLRRVHVVSGVPVSELSPGLPLDMPLSGIPDLAGHFLVMREGLPDIESLLSSPPDCRLTPLDFFTANGIPLLKTHESLTMPPEQDAFFAFMSERGLRTDARLVFATPLPAVTGEMLAGFLPFFAEFISELTPLKRRAEQPERLPGFLSALCCWAYAQGLAIPVGENTGTGRFHTKKRERPGKDTASPVFLRPSADSFRKKIKNLLHDTCVGLHPATQGCGSCRHAPASLEALACHEPEADFPVDVVYTWVNGNDPAHAAKRTAFLAERKDIHSNALDAARFRDNDDLRYSMRSLEMFAPWVRRIIVVTDAQTPSWLNVKHPKIRVVDHADFVPARYLPTFNSHVIEAYLHTIPDLADHFVYLNDDFFLGRPCHKTEFFTPNGLPLSLVDWRWRRVFGYWWTKTPHARSYYNTLAFLKEQGMPTEPEFITAHGPYAQTRSNLSDAFDFYREKIEAFAGNKFRTVNELAMYSHAAPLWLYRKKKIVPCDERHFYVQTDRADRIAYYKGILNSQRDSAAPVFFCINDVRDNSDSSQWLEDFHALMRACFPSTSPYEIGWCGES